MFGRRRWRTPWSSGISGEAWSPGPGRPTWAPKATRSPWAEPSLPPAEPTVYTSGQPSGTPTPSEASPGASSGTSPEAPSEASSGVVDTPTVTVIEAGATASAAIGTAPGGPGAPGATPSSRQAGLLRATGSRESAGPLRRRVNRILASVGVERTGDFASASSGAEPTRQRSPLALTVGEARSVNAPPVEQVRSDGQGQIAPAVIAIAVVCALLGGLAAFAATLGGTTARPHPAASIASENPTAPAGRPRTGGSGAGTKHIGGHSHGGHGRGGHSTTPLPAPTRVTERKPIAMPASSAAANAGPDRPEA